ncbi:MAG TPA: FecR domain-containing protein, partial [Rudaea sp.]|nr:FecR domain-containing protein [Rudaea sp.]
DMRTINDMAARWHAQVMIGRLSPQDEQRLDDWLAQDLRHRLAYAEVAAAGYALQQTRPYAEIDKRAARRWPIRVAAALGPILLLVAVMWSPHAWQDLSSDAHTTAGALRVERLSDGSTLQLDTDTAVALSITPDRRDIELLRGALAVEVAKDSAHPFRVHCAGIEARAVGTRFVVTRHASEVEVGVTEGVVAVSANEHSAPTLIQAGQRALIDRRTGTIRSEPLSATSYGWTRGVLSFDHVPLEQVVAEIARYLPEHVVVRATKHAATPITATFPVDQPDAALRALATTNGLTVRHIAGVLYLVQD